MFLFDSGFATDFPKAEGEIRRILDRAEAEIVFCRKWEERRLAYEIKGHKRGTYVLTYFKCRPEVLLGIERDTQLSESVLRLLMLRADHMTFELMNEFAPDKKAVAPPEEGETPPEKGDTPSEKGETPPEKGDTPDEKPQEGDQAPEEKKDEQVVEDAEVVISSANPEDADEVTES
ncbi:MAG: 30S ribosomal protein S6 [Phycisphaerae bacterium]|nr:30S ribosomal protein S6 [Phycisphaerae bacterium]